MTDKIVPPQLPSGEPDKINGTATVVVGCKLPSGLIIELGKPGDENHTHVRLNGSNANAIVGSDGQPVVGGYGLTTISRQTWELWLNGDKNQKLPAHKHLDFVKKGFVFVHNDMASARDHAADFAGKRNGFEAVDPNAKVYGPDGKTVLLETDMGHLNDGKQAIAQARQAAAR